MPSSVSISLQFIVSHGRFMGSSGSGSCSIAAGCLCWDGREEDSSGSGSGAVASAEAVVPGGARLTCGWWVACVKL